MNNIISVCWVADEHPHAPLLARIWVRIWGVVPARLPRIATLRKGHVDIRLYDCVLTPKNKKGHENQHQAR